LTLSASGLPKYTGLSLDERLQPYSPITKILKEKKINEEMFYSLKLKTKPE
jgi:hypothetical protein